LRSIALLFATVAIVVQRWAQIAGFVRGSDVVLIQKSLGYRLPWLRLERWLIACARRSGTRVVYDVDDAVLVGTSAGRFPHTAREAARTARASDMVLAGSSHLTDALRQTGARVVHVPTCLPTVHGTAHTHPLSRPIKLCWTGVPGNLKYLYTLFPMLRELNAELPISLTILTRLAESRLVHPAGLALRYVSWSPAEERRVLAESHIGLAPLPMDDWTTAKCGARLLAYMAAGLPSVASPVGAQVTLAHEEHAALLATDDREWKEAIVRLATDQQLYARLAAGSRAVATRFAPEQWYPAWRASVLGNSEKDGA
jgi:glycosyltransferase involved in cell wall biosynthesis